MDAIRELLAKQVRELEARNAALVEALATIRDFDAMTYDMEASGMKRIARKALAANAPAVAEREVSGSLK